MQHTENPAQAGFFVGRAAPCTRRGKSNVNVQSGYPWFGGAVSECGDAASTSL